MPEAWIPGRCNETAGFLFRHPCDAMPLNECSRCAKPTCDKHTHATPEGPFCTTCAKSSEAATHDSRHDDPYFYGDRYYDGYGQYSHGHWGHFWLASQAMRRHDPNDFTEADSESFLNAGDEDFESDMTES